MVLFVQRRDVLEYDRKQKGGCECFLAACFTISQRCTYTYKYTTHKNQKIFLSIKILCSCKCYIADSEPSVEISE